MKKWRNISVTFCAGGQVAHHVAGATGFDHLGTATWLVGQDFEFDFVCFTNVSTLISVTFKVQTGHYASRCDHLSVLYVLVYLLFNLDFICKTEPKYPLKCLSNVRFLMLSRKFIILIPMTTIDISNLIVFLCSSTWRGLFVHLKFLF